MADPTGLPAGIGMSRVSVYRSTGPDGQCGGTPHLHLACAELYLGLRGSGVAEFLTPAGPQRVPLGEGVAVQFTPGTVHRLVNGPDPLEILVVMENGRLNEEGDVVFAFPDEDLADTEVYHKLADVGPPAAPDPVAVQRRRDRAVTGFVERMREFEADRRRGRASLEALYRRGTELVRARAKHWPEVVEAGPAAALARLSARVDAVLDGDTRHLTAAAVTVLPAYDAQALTPRMCGDLWSFAGRADV
jgi:mannose-6-phosphate isomerase-like protein (cupin superfamily)